MRLEVNEHIGQLKKTWRDKYERCSDIDIHIEISDTELACTLTNNLTDGLMIFEKLEAMIKELDEITKCVNDGMVNTHN